MHAYPMRWTSLFLLGAIVIGLATTGFECASSEMTAAKVDYNQRKYEKARPSLEAEVRKNPKNEEAWYYLALVAHEQLDHNRVADAIDSAALAGTVFQVKLNALRQNEWVAAWNQGVSVFNAAGENRDSLRLATELFRSAYRLDRSDGEPLRLMANAYQAMGDTERTLAGYVQYFEGIDANVKAGLELGLQLNMPLAQVLKDFGTPDQDKVLPTVDSAHMMAYNAKLLHVFVAAAPGESTSGRRVVGWRTNVKPAKEKDPWERIERITPDPYRQAGNVWYQRGIAQIHAFEAHPTPDSAAFRAAVEIMNKSLPYFSTAQQLTPTDEYASTMLSEVYLRTNQFGKAVKAYQDLVAKFPSNKFTRINYGVLLLKGSEYEAAINQFQEALKVDPSYGLALYYAAIGYKNWSADIQSAVRRSGIKETPEEREKYLARLRKAAEYFERMHATALNDFAPLGQLAEIYAILKETSKMKDVLAALERMETELQKSAEYWDTMGKIYTVLDDRAKAKQAFGNAETLQRR
jgi:tetratricopeptide (TPR) repeat protein